jgi:hypothetical protein
MWIVSDSSERSHVVPAGWESKLEGENVTYVNATMGVTQEAHPLDDFYRFSASLLRRKALRTGLEIGGADAGGGTCAHTAISGARRCTWCGGVTQLFLRPPPC